MTNDERPPKRRRAITWTASSLGGPARLVTLQGNSPGARYNLQPTRTLIGRAEDAHIDFGDPLLSRKHAEIQILGTSTYILRDLGSRNGTFVNGAKIDEAPLKVGDKIRFGTRVVALFSLSDPVEEQILQRQRLETVGRLAAGIAHDFNNMLSAVNANLDYLTIGGATYTAEQTESLNDMRTATDRAAQLSKKLLEFARGSQEGDGTIDVTKLCNEVAQLVTRTFDRNIVVAVDVEPALAARGDGMALHQVLMNLCLNARDAMKDGGKLQVRAFALPASSDGVRSLRIEVIDNGSGISAEDRERIFEPFFSTKPNEGFGLGLSTVAEIIEVLGGKIAVASVVDEGTTFEVTLPLITAQRKPKRTVAEMFSVSAVGENPKNVLLVDDEEMVRRGTGRLLEHAGHTVIEMSNGHEAIRAYASRTTRFDVAILDLEMPVMNGEDALITLRELDPNLTIIIVSGRRDKANEQRLKSLGADAFLAKPYSTYQLLAMLARPKIEPESDPPPTREQA